MKFFVVKKSSLISFMAIIVVLLIGSFIFFSPNSDPVFGFLQESKDQDVRDIHLITAEFKTTIDGKEIEAYRWDPGMIPIEKGEKVNLKIFGINGTEHPFYIEGTDIKGTVRKGQETVVPLQFKEEGVYKIVCTLHQGHAPMIGYIIVD